MPQQDQFIQEVAQSLGNFPFIYYGSYQIEVHDITYFNLYYDGSLPCFELSFYDTLNLMKDKAMPLDDTKIKIFLNPRSQQLKEILIQFKITQFTVNGRKYSMKGSLDINLLYTARFKSYDNMTSCKTLQSIAREAGLGFNTNIDDTNDSMTWIQSGDNDIEFMEKIVEASYKSDNAFMASYIDYYYNFNFVDIEKELERNIDNDLGITDRTLQDIFNSSQKEQLMNLVLTNDESFRETNMFFDDYRIINNSTSVSLMSGYQNIINYYDTANKNLLIFNMDSITSKGDKSIILKGSPQDEAFFNLNKVYHSLGSFDNSNVHTNYKYSLIQNEKNLFDLEKIGLEVTMGLPNYSLYKFQKIKIFISNQATTPSAGLKNERLSGDWLITDIRYVYSQNRFNQMIKLVKRELELSDDELANEASQHQKTTTGDNTTNPITITPQNNPVVPNAPTSSVSATASSPTDISSILTKNIWNLIYNGRVNQKIIQVMYAPVATAIVNYGMDTPARICAFLSQVNIVSSYLLYVTETDSGIQYNNNANLGNGPTDGPTYLGRGLIPILGRNMYQQMGQFFNQDFIDNPTTVAADNATHLNASDTITQLNNCALVSVGYWLNGSSWGNLNKYADIMNNSAPIDTGVLQNIPNTQTVAAAAGYQTTVTNNFSTGSSSSNSNLSNFTLICFGINGGYNGYSDSINEWNRIRQYFS